MNVRETPDAPGTEPRRRLLALVPSDQPVPYIEAVHETLAVHEGDAAWFLQNIPCQAACPMGTDVPSYLASVADGDFEAALGINHESNLLPNVLCHICQRPCEEVCRRASLDAPLAIRALKRAAVEYAHDGVEHPPPGRSGYRVVIVGSGPAGLAAAHDLVAQGHDVTVLERAPVLGGMLALGIPPFRLPRSAVERELETLRSMGVRFQCNVEVGCDVTLSDLQATFDAVVLAAGCQSAVQLDVPGAGLAGVYDALSFMEDACLGRPLPTGKRLVIIGAGCAGLDCARTGLRVGAEEVTVIDIAAREDLAYDPRDLTEAEEEGVRAIFRVRPTGFQGEDGRVTAIELVRVEPTRGDDGRAVLEPVPGSAFARAADAVVVAVSQRPDLSWLADAGVPQSAGRLAADPATGRLGETKLFAAGDFVTGPRYVSEAIGGGRRAARGVHRFLTGSLPPRLTAEFQLVTQMEAPFGFQEDMTEELNSRASAWTPLSAEAPVWTHNRPAARWTQETARRRAFGGEELEGRSALEPPRLGVAPTDLQRVVEEAFAPGTAAVEAQRCLQCQLNVFIEASACTLCGGCIDICPYRALQMVAPTDIATVDGAGEGGVGEAQRWPNGGAIVLNEDRCVRCGLCLARCPTRAITLQQFHLLSKEDPGVTGETRAIAEASAAYAS